MEALFLKLLNMSISASWLVLAVLVLRYAMKKAPKWMTCALWAMVAIRLVFPFSIESIFSLVPSAQTLPPDILISPTPSLHTGIEPMDQVLNAVITESLTPDVGASVNPAQVWTFIAAGIWLIGMAVLLIYAAVSYLLLHRKVAASLCLRDNIYLCDYIESPFILGVFLPRIYLPSSMNESQWPPVIAHEKAHLHRRDHWWKPLGFAILCVYWFNPVLWLAYILLCKDIELACDERVIRDMDTQQKKDYTTALLECSMPRYLIAACPLAFGEVGVKDRVKSVLNYKKPAFWIVLIALILCIIAAVCFLTDPLGNNVITPGVYDIDTTVYLWPYPAGGSIPTIPQGQYTLHNQTLYVDNGSTVSALGRMTPYELDNWELSEYIRNDDYWQVPFYSVPTISEAMWLRMEDSSFFIWFQTNSGETFLARGIEDYGERYDRWEDDTRITQLCRMTYQESAVADDLAWFSGTVVENDITWIVVEPAPGTEESNRFDRIHVSLYQYLTEGNIAVTAVIPGINVGDRVRVVYNGYIDEDEEAWIRNIEDVEKISAAADQYAVTSGGNQIIPLRLPNNTDISAVTGIPLLELVPGDDGIYRFQLLLDGYTSPGLFRLYDYKTREEIAGFDYPGNNSDPDWSLLEPGRNYIVTQEHNATVCFVALVPHDLGITLTGRNITPTGMTVECTQSGGTCTGPITYGNPQGYWLRRITDYGWENVPNLDGTTGVIITTEAYVLEQDSTVTWNYDWTNRFGALGPGNYRFDLYFSHGESLDDLTYAPCSVYFTIGNDGNAYPNAYQFSATVLEVTDGAILVEPLPGTLNHPGMDQIWVSRKLTDSDEIVQDIAEGDIVSILYDGMIAESYPGQINTVYDIQILPEHTDSSKEPLSRSESSTEATTAPPGSYYRFKTSECLYMNPLSSQSAWDDNGRNYVFDSGIFQVVVRPTNEVLFQCYTEDSQWQEFPFSQERWEEVLPDGYDDLSELRELLWDAQYRELSDNYCLFLKDGTLYVAYGFFDTEIAMEYFWEIYELVLG